MKEVAVKMFTEVTCGKKYVFSPNERTGLFRYLKLRARRLVPLNNIKENTLFWLIAARSAISSINTR